MTDFPFNYLPVCYVSQANNPINIPLSSKANNIQKVLFHGTKHHKKLTSVYPSLITIFSVENTLVLLLVMSSLQLFVHALSYTQRKKITTLFMFSQLCDE